MNVKPTLKTYPGTPATRSLIAHEADDNEIAFYFKHNPSSKWAITPQRTVTRDEFMKRKVGEKKEKPHGRP